MRTAMYLLAIFAALMAGMLLSIGNKSAALSLSLLCICYALEGLAGAIKGKGDHE